MAGRRSKEGLYEVSVNEIPQDTRDAARKSLEELLESRRSKRAVDFDDFPRVSAVEFGVAVDRK